MEFKLKSLQNVLEIPRIANVHFFEFSKFHETKNDKHPFCELVFVASGKVVVRSETYTGELLKNQLIVHSSNETHSLLCSESKNVSLIIIGFECVSEKLQYFSNAPITLTELETKTLANIVKEGRNVFAPPYNVPLYDMKKKKRPLFGSEQMLRSLLSSFFIELIRKYEFSVSDLLKKGEMQENAEKSTFEINEILAYVNANFLESPKIDELSFLFHTNRSTLCKEFKKATGQTLISYIRDKKLTEAKRLLSEPNASVAQVVEALRFEDTPYFCRFFKKYTGQTPTEYKRKNKNG